MARYKANSCYSYTGVQCEMVRSALTVLVSKHEAMDMVNSTRKTFLDEKMEEVKTGLGSFVNALQYSYYTPT